MVEYRQRLRVMLSATQGKYYLQKSSIGENIKYIYYFTYFHKFDAHPFWDEFKEEFKVEIENKIKDKLKGLREYVECLQKMHDSLSASVSTYSNPNNLIEKTVNTIRCDIDTIYCDLNCYVVDELPKIKLKLKEHIKKFEEQIKSSDKIISLCVTEIINILVVIRRITLTLKMAGYVSFRDYTGSSSFYQIYFQLTDISEKYEKTVASRTIERRLEFFLKHIKALMPTNIPDLQGLTCDKLCVDKDKWKIDEKIKNSINEIEICLDELKRIIRKLERREGKFVKILKVVETKEDKTERKGSDLSLKDRSQDCTGKSAIFWVYYHYVVNIKETIVKYKQHIHSIKTVVCSEIDNLQKEITCFKNDLSNIKQHLEYLQSIRFFSEQLKNHQIKDVYISGKGALRKIIRISYQLKYVGHDFETIKSNWKNFHRTYYSTQLSSVKTTVSNYQATLKSNHLNGTSRYNPHLVIAKAALQCVKDKLDNLEKYGNNMEDLIKMARILTKLLAYLDRVDSVMSTLVEDIKQLGGQLDTTSHQLEIINTFRDTVEKEIRTIGGYINEIKGIGDAGKEITKLYQAYTAAFSEFNQKLLDLETCLDYFIGNFLTCSLCTTTYNYNYCPTLRLTY